MARRRGSTFSRIPSASSAPRSATSRARSFTSRTRSLASSVQSSRVSLASSYPRFRSRRSCLPLFGASKSAAKAPAPNPISRNVTAVPTLLPSEDSYRPDRMKTSFPPAVLRRARFDGSRYWFAVAFCGVRAAVFRIRIYSSPPWRVAASTPAGRCGFIAMSEPGERFPFLHSGV